MTLARTIAILVIVSCGALVFPRNAELSWSAGSSQTPQTFSVDVDLVLINATVTDSEGRFVTGLDKEQFQIWEDKVPQEIQYLSDEDVPLSGGVLLDVSGSMQGTLSAARSAAVTFLRMGSVEDEYFLIQFGAAARLAQGFTTDIATLQNRIAFAQAKGSTALYDAVYLGLESVGQGMNPRKALVLITDGQDNHSRYSFSQIKEFAKERDVQIYAIGIVDPFSVQTGSLYGTALLQDITQLTGGRAFFPETVYDLENICATIGTELKNQYVLGYRSSNQSKDGKWRKIQIKLNRPKGTPRMNVRARRGYYAPALTQVVK